MKNLMSILCVAVFALATVSVSAQQQGEKAIGANMGLAFDSDYTLFGLGVKFQYNIVDRVRLEPSFNYYFPKTETVTMLGGRYESKFNLWDFNVNVHYLFDMGPVMLYPLAGIGIVGSKAKVSAGGISASDTDTQFAFNLGGGVDFPLDDRWLLNAELKLKIADGSMGVFSVGASYKF